MIACTARHHIFFSRWCQAQKSARYSWLGKLTGVCSLFCSKNWCSLQMTKSQKSRDGQIFKKKKKKKKNCIRNLHQMKFLLQQLCISLFADCPPDCIQRIRVRDGEYIKLCDQSCCKYRGPRSGRGGLEKNICCKNRTMVGRNTSSICCWRRVMFS